jgi:hypothetical protein
VSQSKAYISDVNGTAVISSNIEMLESISVKSERKELSQPHNDDHYLIPDMYRREPLRRWAKFLTNIP